MCRNHKDREKRLFSCYKNNNGNIFERQKVGPLKVTHQGATGRGKSPIRAGCWGVGGVADGVCVCGTGPPGCPHHARQMLSAPQSPDTTDLHCRRNLLCCA